MATYAMPKHLTDDIGWEHFATTGPLPSHDRRVDEEVAVENSKEYDKMWLDHRRQDQSEGGAPGIDMDDYHAKGLS